MRFFTICAGLLLNVVLMVGCTTITSIPSSQQVTLVAAVESHGELQVRRLTQEGIVNAKASQSIATAEYILWWDRYLTRLSILLEPGESEGESVCELKETYRTYEQGLYAVRLEGVAEAGPMPFDTARAVLEVSLEVLSSEDNYTVEVMHKKIYPKVVKIDGQSWLWLGLIKELDPMIVEMEPHDQYLVRTRLALSARRGPMACNTQVSVVGGFRVVVEPVDKVKAREKQVTSLAKKLTEMWAREHLQVAKDPQLQEAAQSIAHLFLSEAVVYVDLQVPSYNRFACYEHARIVREWFETRIRLDHNMARWFRMTTVRRNTFLIWQSSNMITPNVHEPPHRWLDDGTGIVLEPKPDTTGGFYGRYITAREFRMWGRRPELQQTAQASLQSVE